MKLLSLSFACVVVLFAATVEPADAAIQILHGPTFFGSLDGEGNGRGMGIRADTAFSIDSLGIFGDIDLLSYTAEIYRSTDGHDAGLLLASATTSLGGTGSGWNDMPINFSFSAGQFYVLHWRPTGTTSSWATTLVYYYDLALPATIGPVTLIDGEEGTTPNFVTTLH